jgi:hypothetical protein
MLAWDSKVAQNYHRNNFVIQSVFVQKTTESGLGKISSGGLRFSPSKMRKKHCFGESFLSSA